MRDKLRIDAMPKPITEGYEQAARRAGEIERNVRPESSSGLKPGEGYEQAAERARQAERAKA
jgi:hypothetical protein